MNQYIFLNLLIPLIVNLFSPDGLYGFFTPVVGFIVLPIGLLIMNILFVYNKIYYSFSMSCIFMLAGLLLGELMVYFIWGMRSKHLLNPGGEIIGIELTIAIYFIIFSIGSMVIGKILNWIVPFFHKDKGTHAGELR